MDESNNAQPDFGLADRPIGRPPMGPGDEANGTDGLMEMGISHRQKVYDCNCYLVSQRASMLVSVRDGVSPLTTKERGLI